MKNTVVAFMIMLVGICACRANSQVVITTTPYMEGTKTPTNAPPTIQITATSTSTPTAIPTKTPLAYSTIFPLQSEIISPENIKDLQELAVYGKGRVNNFSYSPDGNLLAVATTRGIYFYDVLTYVEKKYIATDDSVNSIAFSPDGEILAITFARGSVQLWDVSSSNLLDILEQNTGRAGGSVLFSPDGLFLFSASGDAVIRMWQISSGKLIRTFRGRHEYSAEDMIDSMSISPDGSLLATTDGYETIWIWRLATGEMLHRLEGGHVVFSPNGEVLAVAKGYFQDDPLVMLWQVPDWTLINTLSNHKGRILNMTFSPDGEILLVNDNQGEAQLWKVSNPSMVTCFQCGERNFRQVLSFSPNGSALATLDWNGLLQVWNGLDGELLHAFNEHLGIVTSVEFSTDGSFLAINNPPSISIWQLSNSTLASGITYKDYSDLSSPRVAFSPDNKSLVFGPFLGGLRLWNFGSTNPDSVYRDGQTVRSLAFSPNGAVYAIGIDNTIEIWSFPGGELLAMLALDSFGDAEELAFSTDGKYLAVGRYGKVEIWRLSDKSLVRTLKGIGYSINQVAFSSNGNISATGTLNTAQWNDEDGRQIQSLPIRGHVFSPDLSLVVTIEGGIIRFYRMSDGKILETLRFDTRIRDITFSFDGKLIAIAGDDGTIGIWGIRQK